MVIVITPSIDKGKYDGEYGDDNDDEG